MKVVILGGGRGNRARRMSGNTTPKPLMKVLGIRPLDLVVSLLQRCPEIDDIRIALEYQSNTMVEYVEDMYLNRSINKKVYTMVNEGAPYGGTLGVLENYIKIMERKGKLLDEQNIIVLSADHIYGMDYSEFIKFHEKNKSDITVAVQSISSEQAYRYGVLEMKGNEINKFTEKPQEKLENPECQISMGIYIFRVWALKKLIKSNLSGKDIGKHAIPFAVEEKDIKVCGYTYNDFWIDVGEEIGVWEAAFIKAKDLIKIKNLVYEHYIQMPTFPWPAEISKSTSGLCRVENGTIVDGSIKNTIIGSGCYIGPQVILDKCVIFKDTIITGKTTIKNTLVGSGAMIHNLEFGVNLKNDIKLHPNFFFDDDGKAYPYIDKFGFIPSGESFNNDRSYLELREEYLGY